MAGLKIRMYRVKVYDLVSGEVTVYLGPDRMIAMSLSEGLNDTFKEVGVPERQNPCSKVYREVMEMP